MLTYLASALLATSISANPLKTYQLIKAREQTLDALSIASQAKISVLEHLYSSTDKSIPANNGEANLGSPTELAAIDPNIHSVTVGYGTITVQFSDDAHKLLRGETMALSLCANTAMTDIYFACGQDFCGGDKFAVTGVTSAFDLTSLPNDVLPASCRGDGLMIKEAREKAAQGDAQAQRLWSAVLLQGAAVPRDLPQSFEMAKASASGGNVIAIGIIGYLHTIGIPNEFDPDPVQALAWWLHAEASGHTGVKMYIDTLRSSLSPDQLKHAETLQTQIAKQMP